MESDFLDATGDILETLHLGLPTRAHHSSDCIDGEGECVELLLEPYDQQNRHISKRFDRLKRMQRNVLTYDCSIGLCQLFLGSGQGSLSVLQHRL